MRKYAAVVIFFAAVNIIVLLLKEKLTGWSIDPAVVLAGNLVIFVATIAAGLLYGRANASEKTLGFLKGFYGGFLLKFLILIAAVALYLFTTKEPNQNGIIVCMALYLVYHFLGTVMATQKPAKKA